MKSSGVVLLLALLGTSVQAMQQETTQPLQQDMAQLKQQVIQLNRELFLLEQALLFPPETQLSLFLSVDTGQFMQIDSVELLLDDEPVGGHLYTPTQLEALKRGAIQPLLQLNIDAGQHQLTAVFVGKGPDNRDYRRAVNYSFEKKAEPVLLELQVNDRSSNYQPEFVIQPWEQAR
jgi:hypothetical protein